MDIRPEGTGKGSQRFGRHGELFAPPSLSIPQDTPTGPCSTWETTQPFRIERLGPARVLMARIHRCHSWMMPTAAPFIPYGPLGHTGGVLTRVHGGSMYS